jgi:Phosphotransferase enzyme family
MELARRLDGLTAAELALVVQKALSDSKAWPLSWEVEALTWAGLNPATAGLFRLTGLAQTGEGGKVPWIVVLKVTADVNLTGDPVIDQVAHQPLGMNYWKREALAFSSGLLTGWPGPLVPVRCYGVKEEPEDRAWIWLEAREGARPHPIWTIEQLADAAYDFGAFGAQWQSKLPDVTHYPWLAQRWLRGWVAVVRLYAVDHFLEHDGCGNDSFVEPFLTKRTRRRIAELILDADDLLATFESLPCTLAHHDPQWNNLFAATPAEASARTVVIDWGFFGIAPIGSDLGLHIGQNIFHWGIDQRRAAEHDHASTAAYLRGLRDFGWDGNTDSIMLARATAAALNAVTWLAMEVSWLCPDMSERFGQDEATWPKRVATKLGISAAAVLERWAAGFSYVLDLADESRQRRTRLDRS